MPFVRPATTPPATPYLHNLTYTDVTSANSVGLREMSADRRTIYATRGTTIVKSTNDGGTWTTVYSHSIGGGIVGFWLLPNSEALYSTKVGGSPGKVYYSTGFAANDTTATWTESTGLITTRGDSYVHEAWGLSFAPAGHVREGLVVATEYGGQDAASETDDSLSPKIWLSIDYGKTFRIIGQQYVILSQRTGQHMHGAIYDPWSDGVVISFGDGSGSNGAKTGVMISYDFLSATPTWSYLYGPVNGAEFQPTTMLATSNSIIMGGDGAPPGIYRIPRRGYRQFGKIHTALNHGGGTDTGWIGQKIYQHSPGRIILLSHQMIKSFTYPNVLNGSFDGVDFFEIWRDDAQAKIGTFPSITAIGPTASGKVLMHLKGDGRTANNNTFVTGDLMIPPKA